MTREEIANVTLEANFFIKVDIQNGLPIDNEMWHYTDIVKELNCGGTCLEENEEFVAVTRLPREIQWELKKAILTNNKKQETK